MKGRGRGPIKEVKIKEALADWNWDPLILTLLGLTLLVYLRGMLRLGKRQGRLTSAQRWQTAAFLAGLLTLFLALISPLHALSELLFSTHMMQHVMLMDVAAPLLALSAPLPALLLGLPRPVSHGIGRGWAENWGRLRSAWRFISRPAASWVIYAGVLWSWHVPALYQTAVEHEWVHALEHVCFLVGALLFWWTVVHTFGRSPARRGAGVLYLFLFAVQSSGLGALLTLSTISWYPVYVASESALGISPLADQQLAGLVMWVPEGVLYMVAALIMMQAWLAGLERREKQPISN